MAFLLLLGFTLVKGFIGPFVPPSWQSAAQVVYLDGTGDSLSVAYNGLLNGLPNTATGEGRCPNGAVAGRAWGAELDSSVCPVSSDTSDYVHSFAAQLYCASSPGMTVRNHAVSGADMLNDFASQSSQVLSGVQSAPSGRKQVLVFMGHNDLCSGQGDQVSSNNCGGNADKDPANYCFTKPEAYEREFRNGLDKLIQGTDLTISVAAPARVSQLCLVKNEQMCQSLLTFPRAQICANAWTGVAGICLPLTTDCSDQRVLNMYNYEKQYRDRLLNVVQTYNNIPVGGQSPSYSFNGKTVGGATKASGVNLVFSDAIWQSQLNKPDISCCDCFHASVTGQQRLADAAFSGVTCTSSNPCCSDSGTAINNAKCQSGTDGVITDGRYIPGLLIN